MKEKNLYPIVQEFLIKNKKCIDAGINLGHQSVGRADVFGIKDIGGQYGADIIGYAVEVKLWKTPLGKNIGQAVGYTLFSHRSYLAVPIRDCFEEEDIEMANRLGVGLIEVDSKKKKCTEILTAKHHQPIEGLFLWAVESLGYSKCSICKEFFNNDVGWSRKRPSQVYASGKNLYTVKEKDYIFFTKGNLRWPIMICKDCLKTLEYDYDKNEYE